MSQRLCPHDGSVLEDKLPPEERLCGQTLAGKYRIEGFLSQGGMGTVYRATHVMLGKPVALKLIRPEIVTSPEVVRRFQREAAPRAFCPTRTSSPFTTSARRKTGPFTSRWSFARGRASRM
jgi:serine/threonine protein kinase